MKFTRLDKILFPQDKITKGDIINYYDKIAPYMLPYTRNRLLSMERFPNGITGKFFFQKDAPDYFPQYIKRVAIPKKEGGVTNYIVCNNKDTILYLANSACLTFHLWLSKINKLENPDKLVFDLDIHSLEQFELARKTAFEFKNILEQLGLRPFVMTTGSKGLHVVVPIKPILPFETVKQFAQGCAHLLLNTNASDLTLELRKGKRDNKLFIDTYRNEYGATSVSPFSVRPHPKAPVATPIFWEELEDKKLNSQTFNINNIFERLDKIQDPWADFDNAQSLTQAIKRLLKKIS